MAKKIILLLIAVMFALVVFNDNAWCQDYSYVYGYKLQQDWRLYQEYRKRTNKWGDTSDVDKHTLAVAHHFIGYVVGVADARRSILHVPDDVVSGELCTIVGHYLDTHPNELKQSGADLVVKAIQNAFPKK